MPAKAKVTKQRFNTIVRQLAANKGKEALERVAQAHGLKVSTVVAIRGARRYEVYRQRTSSSDVKKLDKITQANPIKREADIAPLSVALEQIAKLRARVENLEDAERRRTNEEFTGWLGRFRRGN